jgi:hypothetical protein
MDMFQKILAHFIFFVDARHLKLAQNSRHHRIK